jgi:serine/threonine protein kinase
MNSLPRGTNTLASHLDQQHEGYLYIPGNLISGPKKRWVVLRDNFLYVFKSPKDQKPNGVIFLEGCFIESIDDEKNLKYPYGIDIVFNEEKNKSRAFLAENKEERDEWLNNLKSAAQIYDFNQFYEMGAELGTGKFSSVHECTHKVTQKKYAVKVIDKNELSEKDKESLRTEIAIMQLVSHPNIVKLKNVFEQRHHIYIIMGLVKGGDLFDRLAQKKRFDEYTARSITEKLLKTIQYLHDYGIVHRDLSKI